MKHNDPSHSSSSAITKSLAPFRGAPIGRNYSGGVVIDLGLRASILGPGARLADKGVTGRSLRRAAERQQRRRERSGS